MRIGKTSNYPFSLILISAGAALLNDIVGSATILRETWPIIGPFLPIVGILIAMGGGVWLVVILAYDAFGYLGRREKARRQQTLDDLRLVAKRAGIGESKKVNPRIIELFTRVELSIERLRELKLIPPNEHSPKTLSIRLCHLIPIVESKGIRAAQAYCNEMSQDCN